MRHSFTFHCRLANADQALENLHFYQSAYRSEEPCIAGLEKQASMLPTIVSNNFEDAKKEVELAMVTWNILICHVYSSVYDCDLMFIRSFTGFYPLCKLFSYMVLRLITLNYILNWMKVCYRYSIIYMHTRGQHGPGCTFMCQKTGWADSLPGRAGPIFCKHTFLS